LRAGFEQVGLDEIVAFTATGNQRSRAVMDRLGMREDPEGFDHPAVPQGHPLCRHVLYRIGREDWRLRQIGDTGEAAVPVAAA
jgi:RimJ/RimL family protein N-acetyltransferase